MKVIATALITSFLVGFIWAGAVQAQKSPLAQVVFYVGWYDMGKVALEGLKGVKEVKKGLRGFREINAVMHDPSMITTDEIVSALKAAGTYRGMAE